MIKNRETDILELRPLIPGHSGAPETTVAERFQNETLRPILKLQNDLLLQIFKHYLQKRKGEFYKLAPPKRPGYIGQSVRKDLKFRNLLIGTIAGHFTCEEWETYAAEEPELSRRIVELLVLRLCDQVEKL